MKIATAQLKSTAPMSQSAPHQESRFDGEAHDAYDLRTWMHHLHVHGSGFISIPAMSFKQGLTSAAKFVGGKIKGRGQATWTKRFESGVLIHEDPITDIRAKTPAGEWIADGSTGFIRELLYMNADGVRGSNKRVWRNYPRIEEWSGTLVAYILDDLIDEKTFTETIEAMGKFIGVGRFRPEKGGLYGRFKIQDKIGWVDEARSGE